MKFRTGPSPNELIKQLNLVLQQAEFIFYTPKNLTVRLLKSKGDEGRPAAPLLKMDDLENEAGSGFQVCDEATKASAQMM